MDSTRNRLIDAATELLDIGGPEGVTLRKVGEMAGVSHNAPYKHFANKEDLLAAVAARELIRRGRGLSARSGGAAVERLRSLVQGYVRWAERYPARFKLTFGSWSSESPELGEAAASVRHALVRIVEEAQADGELPEGDPERIAALIQAAAHGAVDLAINGHLSKSGKGHAAAEDLVDDLLAHLSIRS